MRFAVYQEKEKTSVSDWKPEILKRLQNLQLEPPREAEIVEELAQHLADRYAELCASSATEEEALRAVLDELSESQLLAQALKQVEPEVKSEQSVLGAACLGSRERCCLLVTLAGPSDRCFV